MRVYLTPFEIIPRIDLCLQLIFIKTANWIDYIAPAVHKLDFGNAKAAPELMDSPGRPKGLIHFQLFKFCKEFRIQYFDIRSFHTE